MNSSIDVRQNWGNISEINLDKFVRKFVILWQSGCDAKLSVEAEAGNAFVNLRAGLGQASQL